MSSSPSEEQNYPKTNQNKTEAYEGEKEMETSMAKFAKVRVRTNSQKAKSQKLCSICLGVAPNAETPCGHFFHTRCILAWSKKDDTCPNCRKKIDAENLKEV